MKPPAELATELFDLSHLYSILSSKYADLIVKQADYFNTHRNEFKSDTACDRAFLRTEDGISMVVIKQKLKSNEKKMSAIRTLLRHSQTEALNQY